MKRSVKLTMFGVKLARAGQEEHLRDFVLQNSHPDRRTALQLTQQYSLDHEDVRGEWVNKLADAARGAMEDIRTALREEWPEIYRQILRVRTVQQARALARRLSPIELRMPSKSAWQKYHRLGLNLLDLAMMEDVDADTATRARVAAYLLLGLARRKYHPPRICGQCWRHAHGHLKYCRKHVRTDSTRSEYDRAMRLHSWIAKQHKYLLYARAAMADAVNSGVEYAARALRAKASTPSTWRDDLALLFSVSPHVRKAISKKFPIHDVLEAPDWGKVAEKLREALDKDCYDESWNLWREKIHLAEKWLPLEERRLGGKVHKSDIMVLAQQGKIQVEAARDLSVSSAAISKHVEKDEELQALFEENRRNRKKSKRRKKAGA